MWKSAGLLILRQGLLSTVHVYPQPPVSVSITKGSQPSCPHSNFQRADWTQSTGQLSAYYLMASLLPWLPLTLLPSLWKLERESGASLEDDRQKLSPNSISMETDDRSVEIR